MAASVDLQWDGLRLENRRCQGQIQNRQKSYSDHRIRDLEFHEGDSVFLKVSPFKGVMRFGKKGKLSPKYIRPFRYFEGLEIEPMSWRSHLAWTKCIRFFMCRCYENIYMMNHMCLSLNLSILVKICRIWSNRQQLWAESQDLSYLEQPIAIVGRETRKLRSRWIPSVKVIWQHHKRQDATWEPEEMMRSQFPHLFATEGTICFLNLF